MWLVMTLGSALLLGIYDVFKKQALKNNGVLWVLLAATAISTILLIPFFSSGPVEDHMRLQLKAFMVTVSWVSGLIALKLLPVTTASTIKASRPFFVVLFSIVLFVRIARIAQIARTSGFVLMVSHSNLNLLSMKTSFGS